MFDALGMDKPIEQVEPLIPPVAKHGHTQEKGFAASTAEATGMTKQAINRQLARADSLGDAVFQQVAYRLPTSATDTKKPGG